MKVILIYFTWIQAGTRLPQHGSNTIVSLMIEQITYLDAQYCIDTTNKYKTGNIYSSQTLTVLRTYKRCIY